MRDHLGLAIPSPAVMEKMGNRFRKARATPSPRTTTFPIIHFKKGDRHIDVMTPYLEAATGPAVVAIGVAQEFQSVFAGYQRRDYDRRTTVVQLLQGRPAGERLLLLRAATPTSVTASSRSVVISLIRARSGSTGTSGPSARPAEADLDFCELSNGFASCERPGQAPEDL